VGVQSSSFPLDVVLNHCERSLRRWSWCR
jgi:hypothetical protein